jgi:hypothetical protein
MTMIRTKTSLFLNLLALILVFLVCIFLASKGTADQARASANLKVSFKLDPSLTRGMYMGDRWVSPPTYTTSQPGKTSTIEARVESLDKGISPTWTPSNPKMVKVTPQQGQEVIITVLRAGQSSLNVASQGASRTLSIKAAYEGDEIRVEISQ